MSEQNPFAAPTVSPTAAVGGSDGEGPLGGLDHKTVKKLRNASHSIRTLGALWALGCVAYLVLGVLMLTGAVGRGPSDTNATVGLVLIALGIVLGFAVWSAFARPTWGHILGIILCGLGLLGFPIGTLIAALCLYYYIPSGRLFGPGRITHAAINAEFQRRKAAGWN